MKPKEVRGFDIELIPLKASRGIQDDTVDTVLRLGPYSL